MNEVTRYDLTEDVSTGELDITPVPERMEGRYVTFEDYDALRQQLTATTNSLTNTQEALKSAGIEADTVQAGVIELVSRMNRVAAENYDLKHPGTYLPSKRETPATEACLNAVRAEGVDMLVSQKMAEAERYDSNLSREIAIAATVFANQLRTGNAGKDGSHE